MNKQLFKKVCINFNKEPSKELYELWNEQLEDFDPCYVEYAVRYIVANDRFFPTINRVIEIIKNTSIEITKEEKERRIKTKGVIPNWLDKEIINEPIDDETKKVFNEFQNFLGEFRNG